MKQTTQEAFMRAEAAAHLTESVLTVTVKVDGLRAYGKAFTVLRSDGTREIDTDLAGLGEAIENALSMDLKV